MVLLTRGGGRTSVRVQLSPDGAMLTWQAHAAGGESGVMALAMVREVKPVMQGGLASWLSAAPVPLQWQVVADDETAKFEADSETQKETWMSTVEELSKRQAEAKTDRKMGYAAQRRMGLEERRREAERRKADVMKNCGCAGMKHTAAAMIARA